MIKILEGKSIYGGVAIGKIFFHGKKEYSIAPLQIKNIDIENIDNELQRYEDARIKAGEQLQDLCGNMRQEIGEETAGIFEGQMVILEDAGFHEAVKRKIREEAICAEYALEVVCRQYLDVFMHLSDEYFRARGLDLKDVVQRMLDILCGRSSQYTLQEPCIVMAEELTPSQTVQMDREKIKALVTKMGSANSHTAILAKTFGILTVADVEVSPQLDGKMAIVDGRRGILILDPDEELVAMYESLMKEEKDKKELLSTYKEKEAINRFGKKIGIFANVGALSDLETVKENGADGIGLFRSEFTYLKENDFPTEEELFRVYKKMAEEMEGKRVVIRTLDIGSDKKAEYLNLKKEANPALGYRAIRICLTRENIFRTQIRAILRASAYGNVDIMYPMISSVWEIQKIKSIVEECSKQLQEEGIKIGTIKQGIMVETPAAALISDLLAKEVDFFSIGTNDLTQFTLAVDRQNPDLDLFYDAHHEAIVRLMKMIVENAHKEGVKVSVCGELAADVTFTQKLMEMDIDELSVSPALVLEVKKAIIGGNQDAE